MNNQYEQAHRQRLISLLDQIEASVAPRGWSLVTETAVGGLTELGFSTVSDHLLVLSSAGRGVFACGSGEQVARDQEAYGDWLDEQALTCVGIGPIAGVAIQLCGLAGGGLRCGNQSGDSLSVYAPRWPISDVYFCSDYASALQEGTAQHCVHLDSGDVRAYGFSYCGRFMVVATGSDFKLWRKDEV